MSVVSCAVSFFFFSSRRRHTRCSRDWSSDVCSSDLVRSPSLAWRVMQGKGYGRVDLRVDDAGRPWVLEVNPNPDLTDEAGLSRMAQAAGWEYPELVRRIAEVALRDTQGAKAARELLAPPRRSRSARTV